MHLPQRSIKNIQPLPSIYTAFPVNCDTNDSSEHSGRCLMRQVEDGIEVVPLERSNLLSAPILSPDQEEKEAYTVSQQEKIPANKPLPRLPKTLWSRLSLKQRIIAIIGVQVTTLLTIGLSLLAAGKQATVGDASARVQATGDTPSAITNSSIPRGIFAVPLRLSQQSSSACLARMNESAAWQCASDTTFQLNIFPSSSNMEKAMIMLGPSTSSNSTIYYGQQPPEIQPVDLRSIPGASGSEGPVYYFRTTYDQVVLLKENDLAPASQSRSQPVTGRPAFQIGETLWQCIFNETLLEGYIFPSQNSTTISASNGTALGTFQLPKIPRVLKLVEQRMSNGTVPYCEKMSVQENGTLARRQDKKILLDLADPVADIQAARVELTRSAKFRTRQQAQASNFCRCQWMVQ